MTEDRLAQCQGKEALPWRVAARIARAKGLEVYRCPHCRGWHVGNRPKVRAS